MKFHGFFATFFVFRLRRVRYWTVKVVIYDYKIDNQLESEVINMAMYDWNGDGKKIV